MKINMIRPLNVLIFMILFCSVLAEDSESKSTPNSTENNARESRQIRFVKVLDYENSRRPQFVKGHPLRMTARIGTNNGGPPKFNNYQQGLPPNMMIRRRVQSLPTNMVMKGNNKRMPMYKPGQPLIKSRPQVVKQFPRGPGVPPPPSKQFYPSKLPPFTKSQVTSTETKFKASVPYNGNVIVKPAPSQVDYKFETPVANSIRPNGIQSEKGYSVYEVTDDLAQHKPVFNYPKQPQQSFVPQPTSSLQPQYPFYQSNKQVHQPQYQQMQKPVASDEAKQYMSFMRSNQYFLPKLEPDYRKMPTATKVSAPSDAFMDNRKQQVKSSKPTTPVLTYYNTQTEPTNAKFKYPVSYYSDDSLMGTGVSRNGFKSSPPERFEFTENDAIHGSYTSSPVLKTLDSEHQRMFDSLQRRIHSQQEANENMNDDDEDEDSETSYSRMKINNKKDNDLNANIKTDARTEDTEDYCEKICSNVHDDDEQIICGSDNYMYTSEAQLECYSSCLHIDVTIQGKGSCS